MSPLERKYRNWMHDLTMEQASGSVYWRTKPRPAYRSEVSRNRQAQIMRDIFAKQERREEAR